MSRLSRHQWLSFATTRRHRSVKSTSAAAPLSRRLRIEPLEDRRMLTTITVNTLVDENDGVGVGGISLRDAIAAAAPSDTIDFDASLISGGPATIVLSHGELLINKNLAISGPGAELLTVDASGNDPTPTSTLNDGIETNDGDGSHVFNIDDGNNSNLSTVAISGLTLTGGDTTTPVFQGGAIFTQELLTLSASTITGNMARQGGGVSSYVDLNIIDCKITANMASLDGGGIYTAGNLTIDNCVISGNTSIGGKGGAVSFGGGNLRVTSSTISGNAALRGGGINGRNGDLTMFDSQVYGNTSRGHGGGISVVFGDIELTQSVVRDNTITKDFSTGNGGGIHADGNITLVRSTVSGNSGTGVISGGGVFAYGNISLDQSTISGNIANFRGGGVHAGGTLTATQSTVSGNSTTGANGHGGGVFSTGVFTATNSTISGNSTVGSSANGGGVAVGGNATVRYSTITDNHANHSTSRTGGIWRTTTAPATRTILGSIVAGNTAGATTSGQGPDIGFAGTVSVQYSLIGNNAGTSIPPGSPNSQGNLVGTAANPIDPLLGPLANNGGPTLSHALLAGSPAIDAGDPAATAGVGDVPEFDQRGAPFTRVFDGDGTAGARIDMGAFERQPIPPALFGDYNANGMVDAADYVLWRKTLGTTVATAYSGADGDGDTTIDQDDYGVWRAHFGTTVPASIGSGTVGEASGADTYATLLAAGTDVDLGAGVAPRDRANISDNTKAYVPRLNVENNARPEVTAAILPYGRMDGYQSLELSHSSRRARSTPEFLPAGRRLPHSLLLAILASHSTMRPLRQSDEPAFDEPEHAESLKDAVFCEIGGDGQLSVPQVAQREWKLFVAK